ncbi:response regulator transcription factor [Evansella halocellulosilytica]|uniref:response regulator transcription factor n=1 Tax=Evansella halocellulosilytica TaxID=2011013 RepID=UPI000BB6E245|nr:response regulator transcription factor [Evansella halocellulosilytica]
MAKILIIEDELSIAELQRDYLEINGFETEIEQDGQAGLQKALNDNYDLILLDVMLPSLSGFEVCKKIRNEKDVSIIMVTAKTDDIDKIRGLGLGADDYIVKPFSPNELVARVQAHISRYERLVNKENRSTFIRVKDLAIDTNARRVFIGDEEIMMRAKEYDLLVFLAKHPNQVFSKEHLFEKIWGIDAFGDATTVTVHIRKVREKLSEHDSQTEYIETVWGAGYRFLKA